MLLALFLVLDRFAFVLHDQALDVVLLLGLDLPHDAVVNIAGRISGWVSTLCCLCGLYVFCFGLVDSFA